MCVRACVRVCERACVRVFVCCVRGVRVRAFNITMILLVSDEILAGDCSAIPAERNTEKRGPGDTMIQCHRQR